MIKILAIAAFFLALLIAVMIIWFGRSSTPTTPTVRTGTVGEIARLNGEVLVPSDGSDAPVSNNPPQQAPVQTDEVLGDQTSDELSDEAYEMLLPSGWEIIDTNEHENPCDPSIDEIVTTYKNGKETIEVFENGTPTGCDDNTIGDVFYEYNFSSDGSSITVDTAQQPKFCTKDQNPTCPKGDGKVTVFVGSYTDSQTGVLNKSDVTGKTYFFRIIDSGLENDLDAQGVALAELAATIQIN